MIAKWNGEIIAHSTDTISVEGNHYFPPDDIDWSALVPSPTTSRCWWKGKATYFHVRANGAVNHDAAWTTRSPGRSPAGSPATWRSGVA